MIQIYSFLTAAVEREGYWVAIVLHGEKTQLEQVTFKDIQE